MEGNHMEGNHMEGSHMAQEPIEAANSIRIFDALAQPTRFETYRLLLRYTPFGLPAGDIARLLAVPHNTMSAHLSLLERARLVRARREGRTVIYAACHAAGARVIGALLAEMGYANGGWHQDAPKAFPRLRPAPANDRAYDVLLICTGNSARSVMAEAILAREGRGRFRAFSAGSNPAPAPHPMAIDLLRGLGYDTATLASKRWGDFAAEGARAMDFVITLCDAAAGETCRNGRATRSPPIGACRTRSRWRARRASSARPSSMPTGASRCASAPS